jgi:hypothetical protein
VQSERLSAKVNACAERAGALFFSLSGPAALIFLAMEILSEFSRKQSGSRKNTTYCGAASA